MTSIRAKVDDSTLQVGRISHSTHGDSVKPFISENRVGIENDCKSAAVHAARLTNVPLVKLVRT